MKQTKRLVTDVERAVTALAQAVVEPRATNIKSAAAAVIEVRKHFQHAGLPDWAGRSPEYRDAIEHIYRQAGVPSDSESGFQAKLRYHAGNAVRRVAPPEELEALGLAVEGPLERLRTARSNGHAPRTRPARPGVGDPAAMASLALEAVRAIRTMEPGPEVEVPLRRVMDEALDVLRGLPTA